MIFLPEELEHGMQFMNDYARRCFREENGDLLTVDYWAGRAAKAAARRGSRATDVSRQLQAELGACLLTTRGIRRRAGRSRMNAAPRPGPSLSARSVPPSSCAASAPLCRPKPCPEWRVVKPWLNSRPMFQRGSRCRCR